MRKLDISMKPTPPTKKLTLEELKKMFERYSNIIKNLPEEWNVNHIDNVDDKEFIRECLHDDSFASYSHFKKKQKNEFLINPDGKIVRVGEFGKDGHKNFTGLMSIDSIHDSIAEQVLPDADYALDVLVKRGWLIFNGAFSRNLDFELTTRQLRTLERIGVDMKGFYRHGTHVSDMDIPTNLRMW